MALHVVGFTDIIRFDGNTPVNHGRKLLMDYSRTDEFKKLKPGDTVTPYPHQPWNVIDFVAADPFKAKLTVSDEHTYGGPYTTLYDADTDTYYPMFHSDFVSMACRTVVVRGSAVGTFGFVKKNKNFGIIYLG